MVGGWSRRKKNTSMFLYLVLASLLRQPTYRPQPSSSPAAMPERYSQHLPEYAWAVSADENPRLFAAIPRLWFIIMPLHRHLRDDLAFL
jgi:hypothetical protein